MCRDCSFLKHRFTEVKSSFNEVLFFEVPLWFKFFADVREENICKRQSAGLRVLLEARFQEARPLRTANSLLVLLCQKVFWLN